MLYRLELPRFRKWLMLVVAIAASFQFNSLLAKTDVNEDVPDQVSAIINGSLASVSTYPWIGFLATEFEEQYCGASLISETWVLTAAHCFLNEEGDTVDIETGANSIVVLNSDTSSPLADSAIVGQIGQIIVHPDYDPNFETSDNVDNFDIALVELTSAVDLTPVSLISADAPTLEAGTQTIIMGWGTTAVSDEGESLNPSNDLLQANQQIVDNDECSNIYGGGITDFMLCAGAEFSDDITDTCQGDSGGPMVVANSGGYVQIGIVSFGGTETGPPCGDPDAPGVYADVSALADFIASNTTGVQFVTPDLQPPSDDTDDSSDSSDEPSIVLEVEVAGNDVLIFWSSLFNATGYTLYYAPAPAAEPISSLDMGPELVIGGELPSGAHFFVAIEPYNEDGPLPVLSNIVEFMVP